MSLVRLIKPYIDYAEVEQDFRQIFDTGIFTRGSHVEAFRGEIASYVGAKHAFLTTSATTALWLCLKMLGVGPGDEVIVSDFSFPATANVVEDIGAKPVFADVSIDTYNMLPNALESRITPRTKAVVFVDALGNPSGLHDIQRICHEYGLPLIEDAACAIGSAERGKRCGSVADLTCFSFHPRKLICTGEGGAITTNNDEWAAWLDVKLNHGAHGMKGVALDFIDYGYNFRMSELPAILGRKQLAKLDKIVAERNEIRARYVEELAPLGFQVQKLDLDVIHNIQSLVFRVPEIVERDKLVHAFKAQGIETTIGTYCLSGTTYYRKKYGDVQPNAAALELTTITLPCYDGIDIQRVTCAAREFL
jgi:dTDP-4-amino-4,6-dideoxygalactose transaminase